MKVWFIQSRSGRGGKFFFNETAYLRATHKDDTRKVFILETTGGNMPSGQYSEALISQRERDNQLSNILGESDNFTLNFSALKELFEKICPGGRDNVAFYTSKSEVSKSFKIISEKKVFSTYVTNSRIKKFLLLHVSDSVEWYQALLRCHAFQSLPSDRRTTISEQRLKNFVEAKESLRKKKK
jgi:hypothetical protein